MRRSACGQISWRSSSQKLSFWRPSFLPGQSIRRRLTTQLLLVEIERRLLIDLDAEFDLALLFLARLGYLDDEIAGGHAEQRQRRLQLEPLQLEVARLLAANRERPEGDRMLRRRRRSRELNRRLGRRSSRG